jgi:hypothetical protein
VRLIPALRGALNGLRPGKNTLRAFTLMVPPALAKLPVPADSIRTGCDRVLNTWPPHGWLSTTRGLRSRAQPPWQIRGFEGLNRRGVSGLGQPPELGRHSGTAAHLPWTHSLSQVFLERELIWVPAIGLAWWALDFPFMKRGRGRSRGPRNDPAILRKIQASADGGHQFR